MQQQLSQYTHAQHLTEKKTVSTVLKKVQKCIIVINPTTQTIRPYNQYIFHCFLLYCMIFITL